MILVTAPTGSSYPARFFDRETFTCREPTEAEFMQLKLLDAPECHDPDHNLVFYEQLENQGMTSTRCGICHASLGWRTLGKDSRF